MARWNNTLEQNCKDILDNVIKNLKPDLYQSLLLEVLDANIANNKKILEKLLRNNLRLSTTLAKHTIEYWKRRGWDDAESYINSKNNKRTNCKSVYSREYWLEKINPSTGVKYTIEDSDFERNSRRPIRKEYWINQGYKEDDAIELAANVKDANNKKGAAKSSTSTVRRVSSKRCAEYYTYRGYSIGESQEMVANSQKYFSKEICIEKYGNVEGLSIWQNRQDVWQATLNGKSDEEKFRINRLKLSKGITVSKNERLLFEEVKKNMVAAIHQFTLNESDKKYYVYDIMANNKIIEYNGDFWHSNPDVYRHDYVNPRTKIKAVDKWALDSIKIRYAQSQGYEVLVIWERDFKNNTEETIKKCIQFLIQ